MPNNRPSYRPAQPYRGTAPAGAHAAPYSRDSQAYHQASKSAKSKKRIVIAVVAAVLVVLLGAGTAFAVYMAHINDQLTRGDKTDEELMALDETLGYQTSFDEPFYLMLIGSDRREGDSSMGARSDTNIVVRVDPIEDQLTMVSIPRDTKIDLEDYGTQKFNAAYSFGGAAGAIEAAEDLLDIEISHYAEVNFKDLSGLVDAVGGVTVEVEETIDDYHCDDGDGNHYVIEEGTQTLSGGEALTFARCRQYADGDFTRQSHQRQLIEAIIDKVLHMPITSIPGVIEAASKCVTTDLNVLDVIGLAQMFADEGGITIYSAMLPSYTQNINGISFVINDTEKTKEMMEVVEEGGDPSDIVSTMTAADVYSPSVDTSNVLLFDDDDEVIAGSVPSNTDVGPSGGASSSAGAAAPSAPGGSAGAGTSGGNGEAGSSGTVPDNPGSGGAGSSAGTAAGDTALGGTGGTGGTAGQAANPA